MSILKRYPQRIPATLVLQPNSRAELIRDWAWRAGFWLVSEQIVRTTGKYTILAFKRAPAGADQNDPAYDGVDQACGFAFGPLMLKENSPAFVLDLHDEERWWSQFSDLQPRAQRRLMLIRKFTAGCD